MIGETCSRGKDCGCGHDPVTPQDVLDKLPELVKIEKLVQDISGKIAGIHSYQCLLLNLNFIGAQRENEKILIAQRIEEAKTEINKLITQLGNHKL